MKDDIIFYLRSIFMAKAMDITGQKFGKLTAIERMPSRNGKTYWKCKCECGTIKEVQTGHLKSGAIQSCGGTQCQQQKIKYCEICGKEFNIISINATTRKYCYECSPPYLNNNNSSRAEALTVLRQAMKKEAVKRRGGECEKCGYNKCIAALHFHHRDPSQKDFGLSNGGITHSWSEFLLEVEKCDLLCANCHAEVHFNQ